jgi:hypothetical protein
VPTPSDADLAEAFLEPIRTCADYVPKFGRSRSHAAQAALGWRGFDALYSADPFYSWLGLNDERVYAAHKAAGGLTSLYRQIGVGSERLFRRIIGEVLGLTDEQMRWSYTHDKGRGKTGVHSLDARISAADLGDEPAARLLRWLTLAGGAASQPARSYESVVFEVRQGYKSADSKRQNADLRFGMRAYRDGLVPALAVMSTQVSEPVIQRYRTDGIVVLTGSLDDDPTVSTFAFFDQVVGYDLIGFLSRNSRAFSAEIERVIGALLSAE